MSPIRIILRQIRIIRDYSRGFTLAEVIVSVSVMALLSAVFIGYSRSGSAQIKILKNKSEFIAMMYRARSLAVATYQYDPPECGYGIHVFTGESPVRRYVLWRDTAGNGDCNDADPALRANGIYDINRDANGDGKNDEDVEFFTLDSGIEFGNVGAADFMSDILFIPPDPRIIRNGNSGAVGQLRVVIGTPDGSSGSTLNVNDYGQVEE
ncbi:MAG: type II secretion system protein [bacterium]|nr:type II secretion system protein [bacterium]